MRKRIIALVLAFCMVLSLCACGESGRYKSVKTIADRSYSIGFRNGDSTYHYIDKALRQLSYEGVIDDLAIKWFGSKSEVSFPSKKDALKELGYIAPREFIIGVDLDSAPLAMRNGEDYDGFDIELARKVCEKLGWTLKIQPISSEKAFVELNSGNIDCAWGGIALDKESPDYTILVTYMKDKLIIAGKGGESSSLRGKTLFIGTAQQYYDLMLEKTSVSNKLGEISRVQGTAADYFNALNNSDCDFILTTEAATHYYNNH